MGKEILRILLTGLQYLSIILSSILGIFGLMFNYKDKETGRLTRNGKIALSIMVVSLCLGLSSKIVEQILKQRAEVSEATRARIAAEQSLKISRNVERIVNAFQAVSVDADFYIEFDSPIFASFRDEIYKRFGESWNDRDFSPQQVSDRIPNAQWKHLIRKLTFVDPVLKVFPKGSVVPDCIHNEYQALLEFKIPVTIDNIEIPQQASTFNLDYHGYIYIMRRDSTQVLSLTDFKGATIVAYMFLPTKEEIPIIDSTVTSKDSTRFEKQFPVSAWNFSSIDFHFDNDRVIRVRSFELKRDKCTGQQMFIAHLAD